MNTKIVRNLWRRVIGNDPEPVARGEEREAAESRREPENTPPAPKSPSPGYDFPRWGQLLPFAPRWNHWRGLSQYNSLTNLHIPSQMARGGTWIDVGCGSGRAMWELAAQSHGIPGLLLVGVNLHPYQVPAPIQHLLADIPSDPVVHERHRGQAKLVTDVYGAVSYGETPLETLIYEASLLGPEGTAVVFTEGERFGSPGAWKKIERFFNETSGQKVKFEDAEPENYRHPLDNFDSRPNHAWYKPWSKCLRITITGQGSAKSLSQMTALARERIGPPRQGEILFRTGDGKGEIRRVDYQDDPTTS